jgi:release factor glutamine methyltransferase
VNQASTIQVALMLGRRQLQSYSDTPSLDVQVLLASLIDQPKSWVLAHPEYALSVQIQAEFFEALARLCTGEPLPYVLGQWEFYGRRFKVSSRVMIPRPETEQLIELGLDFIDSQTHPLFVADVGTGSGCVAITLAAERPSLRLVGTDRSKAALRIAEENAALHGVTGQIDWVQADLLGSMLARFDLVLANLPYVPTSRLGQISVAKHEPTMALDGGELGLDLIKALIVLLPDYLADHGMALLEIDESHGPAVVAFAREIFPRVNVALMPDLAGLDRYISIDLRV